MDLVTPRQHQRLAALERVAAARCVEAVDLRRQLAAFALLLALLVGSISVLAGVVLGVLWLLA